MCFKNNTMVYSQCFPLKSVDSKTEVDQARIKGMLDVLNQSDSWKWNEMGGFNQEANV